MTFVDTSKHIISLFLQQVEATPDAPALEDRDHAYTYAELSDKVDSLAHRLRAQGIDREKLVGILLPHTADFIIACLASLRAGGAYLILELPYPAELLNDVIQDAKPPVLITYQSEVRKINPDISLVVLDEQQPQSDTISHQALHLPIEYDQDIMAFVSYSSGTTGRPKGIVNHDRPGVLSYNQRFAISDQKPGDRIACNTFFIWEMFRPLIRGATAIAVPDDISYDPVGLVELLRSKRISETLMTPTLLASILAQFHDVGSCLPDLRVLWVTGEVVTADLARRALAALPHVRLLNSYSTSETWDTAIGEMKDVLHDAEQSTYCSVGTPLGVNQIYILDESGDRLGPGVIGEIFIGGPVLALGYLNLPEVTAKTFLPDPFSPDPEARMYRSGDLGRILPSGALEITGRIGAMIKLRGYSVVPAKIQTTIITHLAVRNCAIISHGDGLEKQLVAYYVQDKGPAGNDRPVVDADELGFSPGARRILAQHLPTYMIPTYWVEVTRLPADPVSGKVDRKRLPPPPIAARETAVAKGTRGKDLHGVNIEAIAELWALTLNIPLRIITSSHSFFDLGGHSLSLATLSCKLAARFGIRVPVAQLMDPPTLEGHLASILTVKCDNDESTKTKLSDMMRAHCSLDGEIKSLDSNTKMCFLKAADTVLLTGVTGFLGAFLLHDLMKETSAKILCLVRVDQSTERHRSAARAKTKIRDSLLEKELWHDSFMNRIEVIVGDLSQKYFGFSPNEFRQLATRIQVIIHAGAAVNLILPYAALKNANVVGTREILRLASFGGSTVQYVSTDSVLPPSSPSTRGWPEETNADLCEVVRNASSGGYAQTKWVAEQLVHEAQRRGISAQILRIGTISGHSITGIGNTHDLLTALIIESIELGYYPEVEQWRVEMTPVDFVSKAIIRLSNVEAAQGVFHLGNPQPLSGNTLSQILRQLGYLIEPLDWDQWVRLWNEKRGSIKSDNFSPITILRSGMPSTSFLTDLAVLSNSATEPHHTRLTRPKIDNRLLETYSRYWFTRGWISKLPSRVELPPRRSGSLKGCVAVITGASSGIGAATAVALAQEGVHIALGARRTEAMESIKNALRSCGVKIMVHQTDVTNAEQVEALMHATVEELGPIDILIACAGVMYYTLMKNARKDEWERTLDVNCKGLLHCLSSVVPGMIRQGKGHVVAISSDAGRKIFAGLGVYSGSKFFVEATLQSLRLETVGTGLRVTSIQPGNVATDLLDLSTDTEAIEKYGKPSGAQILDAEDVANAIMYALKQPESVSVNEILIQPRDEPN